MQNVYIINGTEYWIDEFDAGWLWTSAKDQSDIYYSTANEALQGAMEYVSRQEDEPMSEEDKIANAADFKNDSKWEDAL